MSTSTPDSTSNSQQQQQQNQKQKPRLLRLTILAYKSPNLTEDEFHHHWSNVHAPLASAHLAKFGIVGYKQYHTPRRLNNPSHLATTLFDSPHLPLDQVDYDGFVELLMPDLKCWHRARQDEYYRAIIQPDEEYFADMARSRILVGWEEDYVVGGEVVGGITRGKEERAVEEERRRQEREKE